MATVLAFIAVLILGLLPCGLVPKVGGPCGKALCQCVPQPTAPRAKCCSTQPAETCACCRQQAQPAQTPRVVLVSAPDSRIAFQPFAGAWDVAPVVEFQLVLTQAPAAAPECSLFSPRPAYLDVAFPPPRARQA